MPSPAADRIRITFTTPQAVPATTGVLWRPAADSGRCGVVLAHGAGSDLDHPALCAVAAAVAAAGWPVLTFNFAYAEARRRRPDPLPRLRAALLDAVAAARDAVGDRPLVLGGRSLGGRVASLAAADGQPCAGLVLLSYPLHPAGRPDTLRVAHWPHLTVPVLFVSGTRDRLCDPALLARERAALSAADVTVHWVAGADHSFGLRRSDGRTTEQAYADAAAAVTGWLDRLPASRPVPVTPDRAGDIPAQAAAR